jgi:catechol 2,3-dioxygenase-like lactoylglutathione lyase family enzyme
MPIQGPLDHVDMSVGDPERSIPFYAAFFEALGYTRLHFDHPDYAATPPRRASWALRYPGGAAFGVEVRPADPERRHAPVDRYAPGLHHMAFHAASRAEVDRVHAAVRDAGGTVLDPPCDYGGQPGYQEGYYAAFFADPDGVKLEVLHLPLTNP